MRFEARPLTPETWSDLDALFALPGGSIVRGCWCMYYRTTGSVSVSAAAGVEHKTQLCDLVESGVRPGLVGYADGRPAGWISLGPREDYLKLRRSRVMKPVDDAEVWSIVCTFVAKEFRGQGLQHRLLAAALDFARDNGVRLVEPTRSTSPSAATTTSCSSAPAASTSAPDSLRSCAARPRAS